MGINRFVVALGSEPLLKTGGWHEFVPKATVPRPRRELGFSHRHPVSPSHHPEGVGFFEWFMSCGGDGGQNISFLIPYFRKEVVGRARRVLRWYRPPEEAAGGAGRC